MYERSVPMVTPARPEPGYSAGVAIPQRAWRSFQTLDPRVADASLALVLTVGSVIEFVYTRPDSLGRLPFVAGATLALAGRRRWPIVCYLTQFGFGLLTAQPPTVVGFFGFLVGGYSVGLHSRWRLPSLGLLVGCMVLLQLAIPEAAPPLPRQTETILLAAGIWLAGNAVRARQAQTDMLTERSRRLEREQELAKRVAVADERSRIARELHDVVAHSVSVMVVQSGAARTMLNRHPERVGETLRSVEGSGREALTELRRLLGVLTDDAGEATLAPQPGLGQLDALVERVTSAGLPVDVRIEGAARPLPPGLDLTAYRILQEALTNVLKHARGARAQVVLRYAERELGLEVVDRGGRVSDGSGPGDGLLGMKERVSIYGGELDAAHQPEGCGIGCRRSCWHTRRAWSSLAPSSECRPDSSENLHQPGRSCSTPRLPASAVTTRSIMPSRPVISRWWTAPTRAMDSAGASAPGATRPSCFSASR